MKTKIINLHGRKGKKKNAFFEICNAVKTAPPVMPTNPVKTVFQASGKVGANTYTPPGSSTPIKNTNIQGLTQAQIDEAKRQEAAAYANDPNFGGGSGGGSGSGGGGSKDDSGPDSGLDIMELLKKYWYLLAIVAAAAIYFFVIREK